MRETEVLFKK